MIISNDSGTMKIIYGWILHYEYQGGTKDFNFILANNLRTLYIESYIEKLCMKMNVLKNIY
jgi:hypothetical protein